MIKDARPNEFGDKTETEALSPLADPVVEEIYKDESVAGLAAGSFISAVLAECGEKFGTIVELTPQKRQTRLGSRSCYIDVLAKSSTGKLAAQEVQLYFDPSILQRNLLEASHLYVSGARRGTTALEMASEMPNISAINIFGHLNNCRKDNTELLQPIHCVYDKEPRAVALKQFAAFNIQLPCFPKAPEDYSNLLYCWCKLLYEMHFNKKLPREVFEMEPRMGEFAANDMGATQFVTRYSEVAASPAVQQAYHEWIADFREMSIIQGARMEGHEQGLKEGLKQGIEQGLEKAARRMLKKGRSVETIMEDIGLTREQIDSLR
jgi:hypothetical protein